ncbi:hypothetical protein acdb102_33560 [Acidothermaceae bacterium B102]|nr:hypothetical protein acdb102_33560 [Acidothermaceae bacterium B102]
MDNGAVSCGTATSNSNECSAARRWGVPLGTSAALVIGLLTACGTPHHQAAHPSHATAVAAHGNASAADVVRAYVGALNRHDVALASTLVTAEHLHIVKSEADSWFTNVKSITALHVGTAVAESTSGGGDLAAGYRQAMRVPVTFTLQQKHAESMPDGVSDWGYLLVRNADAEPWLIADEGMG